MKIEILIAIEHRIRHAEDEWYAIIDKVNNKYACATFVSQKGNFLKCSDPDPYNKNKTWFNSKRWLISVVKNKIMRAKIVELSDNYYRYKIIGEIDAFDVEVC